MIRILVGVVVCFTVFAGGCADVPTTQRADSKIDAAAPSSPVAPADIRSGSPTAATGNGSACTNPEEAGHQTLEEGTAIVHVCIDENGVLTGAPEIIGSSGSCRLDMGALRLAREASGKYHSATENGKPVSGCFSFAVKFRLREGEQSQ